MIAQLQTDLESLAQAKADALDELERLRHDLTLTVDVDEAERISTRINALETVSGNLDERLQAKQQAIADAQLTERRRQMVALKDKRRQYVSGALDGLRDALAEMDKALDTAKNYASVHWQATKYPDTSVNVWRDRHRDLELLVQQIERDLGQ